MSRVLLWRKLSLRSRKSDWRSRLRLQREFKNISMIKMTELLLLKRSRKLILRKSKKRSTQR